MYIIYKTIPALTQAIKAPKAINPIVRDNKLLIPLFLRALLVCVTEGALGAADALPVMPVTVEPIEPLIETRCAMVSLTI